MKKILFIPLLFNAFNFSIAQCPSNLGFEDGTTNGWVCKSGSYGSGPCVAAQFGVCPNFLSIDTTVGYINANGINASLTTGSDRHTIVDKNYYGTGIDPNSVAPYLISVIPPGGGNYSFRLGDATEGNIGGYALSEAIRLTFNITPQNAVFNYQYSLFIQDPGHWPEEQPRFEVNVTLPDSNDTLISGFKIVAGIYNPLCSGTGNFHSGLGLWKYNDWTNVGLDLSNYIGQKVAIEFRTDNCFPGSNKFSSCNGNCCTITTYNGATCKDSINCTGGPPWCTGIPACNNHPGDHSCYVYLDASCQPLNVFEYNSKFLKISPNPLTSSFILQLTTQLKDAEVVIYDMLGKEMIRKKLTGNRMEIERGSLESGVYFVKVSGEERQWVERIIIE